VELNQSNITIANINTVKQNVEALIGFFNLDPNRVLDIILDSFMNNLWNCEPNLILLRDYKGEYIAQILGFKFQSYHEKLQTALKTCKDLTTLEDKIPKSLCLLTAIVIAR
jgi:THO complex subunit 2